MTKFAMEGEGPQIAVNVPLFLKKLWKMVNDNEAEDIIGWNSAGDGFVIYDQLQFVTKLLPQYFKHNNMASFVRQLNFYDFHKVAGIDKDEMHFSHNCFLKDLPETLVFIKRKCTSARSKLAHNIKEEEIGDLLNGVKDLKTKHTLVDNELKLLKQENAALWSEINNLRVKHAKQTKIINKIIHFLISYMHSQNTLSKRNGPISRKNGQKNLRTGPTILEIDYHNNSTEVTKHTKQNSYVIPELSDIFTYKTKIQNTSDEQPVAEKSLDAIINTVASSQDKMLASKKMIKSLPRNRTEIFKTDALDVSNTDVAENPKIDLAAGPIVNSLVSPRVNIMAEPKIDMLENPIVNVMAGSVIDTFGNSIADANTMANPKPKPVENSVATIINTKPNTLKNTKANTSENRNENYGLYFFDSKPVPAKDSMKYNRILDSPKDNLGLYLDNTQLELNSLQDMLNNLSSAELSNFCSLMETVEPDNLREDNAEVDLLNLSQNVNSEQVGNLVSANNEVVPKDILVEDQTKLPMECDSLDESLPTENANFETDILTEENIPEVLVDEYFNSEF